MVGNENIINLPLNAAKKTQKQTVNSQMRTF